MNKFLFILGSNWQLSIAELDNYLKNSQNKGKIVDYSANIAVVEFDRLHEDRYYANSLMEIQFTLGGCQKIGEVYDFIDIHTIYKAFPLKIKNFKLVQKSREKILSVLEGVLVKAFPKIKNESIFFATSIYPNLFEEEYYSDVLIKHFLPFLNKEIMEILKRKGVKKSLYYKYPEEYIKSGHLNPIFPHHVIKYGLLNEDRAEIIFGFTEEGVYIARTFTTDDPNFKKLVDEERPAKEFKSSISPKLALTMINFLNLFEKRDKYKIFDPFVGNGTVLMFALIQDFQVFGADIDEKKVKNTLRNLNWLLQELEEPIPPFLNKRIKQTDIKNISNHFDSLLFDGIVTEPVLGPYYLEKPYYVQALDFAKAELEPNYNLLFKEAFNLLKPNARICVVAPIISTIDGGDIQINIQEIAKKNHFKLVPMIDFKRIVNKSNQRLQFQKNKSKTIIDAKKNQVIKRKIFVFEKSQ